MEAIYKNSLFLVDEIEIPSNDLLATRKMELWKIRDLYIPQLILWHHDILFETKEWIPGNLEKSLLLARVVSDDRIYQEFTHSGKLNEFLFLMRKSAMACLVDLKDLPWCSL